MKLAKGLLLAAVVAAAAPALGDEPVAGWSLNNTLSGGSPFADALSVGDITAGNGVGTLSLSAKGYSGQGWNGASRNEDAYFEFSVTAATNWSFSPGSLSMNFRSARTGPAKAEVRWSIDGSAWTTAGTMDVPLDGNDRGHPFTVDFTGVTVGSGETFAIRIYAWGASAKTGTFRIGNAYAMTLSGSVARRKMVTATVANPARIFAEDEMNEQDVVTFGFGEEGFSMPNGEEMGYLFLVPRNDSSSNLVESVVFGEDWNLGALVWTGDQTCGPFPMLFLDNNRTPTERMGYDIVVRSAQTWDEGYTADTWSSPGFDFTVTNVVPTVKRAFMGGSEVNESGNQMAGRALAGVPQVFKAETSEPSGLDLYSDSENGYGDSSKAFATKWAFALGGDRREFAVKGPPGVTALTHAFDRAGVWTVIVSMRDKDMVSDGQETWGPEFPFTVVVDAPPSVTNVVARQRWPWNGLVDVDYEVGGDTNLLAVLEARISFTASDGRSWTATNFLAGAEPSVEPGAHRATWNAAAAAGAGVVASNVVATVALVRPPPPRWCVVDLSGGVDAASYPVAYFAEPPAGGWNADAYKTTNLVLRLVKPSDWADGTFAMRGGCEATLTNAYWIGVFETTQRQWELVKGDRPSYFRSDDCYATRPVEQVSYEMIRGSDAGSMWPDPGDVDDESFLGRLRARTGLAFDLPTEAQWEFACRAGTTTDYNNGTNLTDLVKDANLDLLGRYKYNGGEDGNGNRDCDPSGGTAAAGSYLPNKWGLYDCHGNVWEWCLDWYGALASGAVEPVGAPSGEYRVLRGGGWGLRADFCLAGLCGIGRPSSGGDDSGFRLCLAIGPEPAAADGDGGAAAEAASGEFRLDTREGPFESDGTETLTYSARWHGTADSRVSILQSDRAEPVASGLSGEGDCVWRAPAPGTYTLFHETADPIDVSDPESATFTILPPPEPPVVSNVVARQRWPWNGLVDVDYEVGGSTNLLAGLEARISFAASDRRSWVATNFLAGAEPSAAPGAHRATWDTTADDATNVVAAEVVATVELVREE